MNNIYDTQLAISGATLNHVGMFLERQKLEDGKVTPGDFRDLMGRCHRRTDMISEAGAVRAVRAEMEAA